MIDPRQLRKALALLDWTSNDLSDRVGIDPARVESFIVGAEQPSDCEARRMVDVIGEADRKQHLNPRMAEDLLRPWLTGDDSVDRAHYGILQNLERLRAVNRRLGEIYPQGMLEEDSELYDLLVEKMKIVGEIERLQQAGSSGDWYPHLQKIRD
ncbi:MAG: hypothetical protein RIB97_12250 [Nitratireductor sp.]